MAGVMCQELARGYQKDGRQDVFLFFFLYNYVFLTPPLPLSILAMKGACFSFSLSLDRAKRW
jgi:hypothetical protein